MERDDQAGVDGAKNPSPSSLPLGQAPLTISLPRRCLAVAEPTARWSSSTASAMPGRGETRNLWSHLTPPPEDSAHSQGNFPWKSAPSSGQQLPSTSLGNLPAIIASVRPHDASSNPSSQSADHAFSAPSSNTQNPHPSISNTMAEATAEHDAAEMSCPWLDDAMKVVLAQVAQVPAEIINVVCYAQPAPAIEEGEVQPTTAIHAVMAGLVATLQTTPLKFIRLGHILPRHFPLTRIPSTPNTPDVARSRSPGDQEDYFFTRIFTAAVPMDDRHDVYGASHTLPPTSPMAAPPSTVHVALYERFIPPASTKEYLDLFEATGPSALVDRLVELAPSGTLVFIYPTKTGADHFLREYLNLILEPLLRYIIWKRSLSADLGTLLSKMPAVAYMEEYPGLLAALQKLLTALSRATSQRSEYSIAYASSKTIPVRRRVWEAWYLQQETPRIQAQVEEYLRRAANVASSSTRTGVIAKQDSKASSMTSVIREPDVGLANDIIDGIRKGSYDSKDKTTRIEGFGTGIEVGVFVVTRIR